MVERCVLGGEGGGGCGVGCGGLCWQCWVVAGLENGDVVLGPCPFVHHALIAAHNTHTNTHTYTHTHTHPTCTRTGLRGAMAFALAVEAADSYGDAGEVRLCVCVCVGGGLCPSVKSPKSQGIVGACVRARWLGELEALLAGAWPPLRMYL